eukprot:9832-Pelagococcus_subviridis.AAC.1
MPQAPVPGASRVDADVSAAGDDRDVPGGGDRGGRAKDRRGGGEEHGGGGARAARGGARARQRREEEREGSGRGESRRRGRRRRRRRERRADGVRRVVVVRGDVQGVHDGFADADVDQLAREERRAVPRDARGVPRRGAFYTLVPIRPRRR